MGCSQEPGCVHAACQAEQVTQQALECVATEQCSRLHGATCHHCLTRLIEFAHCGGKMGAVICDIDHIA
jgi:hypothetical protein